MVMVIFSLVSKITAASCPGYSIMILKLRFNAIYGYASPGLALSP